MADVRAARKMGRSKRHIWARDGGMTRLWRSISERAGGFGPTLDRSAGPSPPSGGGLKLFFAL